MATYATRNATWLNDTTQRIDNEYVSQKPLIQGKDPDDLPSNAVGDMYASSQVRYSAPGTTTHDPFSNRTSDLARHAVSERNPYQSTSEQARQIPHNFPERDQSNQRPTTNQSFPSETPQGYFESSRKPQNKNNTDKDPLASYNENPGTISNRDAHLSPRMSRKRYIPSSGQDPLNLDMSQFLQVHK
jgi:hypothetical protein